MELTHIQHRIYEVRGRRVMLDRDLAALYGVETRSLKQSVRRNIERFPPDFLLRLTPEEANSLIPSGVSQIATPPPHDTENEANSLIPNGVSQFVIPPGYNSGGAEIFAFTQEGVAMLSGVLRSDRAIAVNIEIMRAFVALRQLVMASAQIKELALENREIKMLLEEFIEETEGKFDDVYVALSKMAVQKQIEANKPRRRIGFRTSNDED